MTERRTSPLVKGLAWFFGICAVLAIFAASQSDGGPTLSPQESADAQLSIKACMAAQDAVRGNLKAPASAKFPGCAMGAHEYNIRADEARNTFWVSGHVDAQNAFGAMLRSEFGVKLERRDGELVAVNTVIE